MNKSFKDLVEYVKNSIDILVSMKLAEELEKYKYNDDDSYGKPRDYEKLLQKLEQNIREHISIEHQLKLQCEKFVEKLDILEDEKIVFYVELVSIFYLILIYNNKQEETKREFNEQIEDFKKQSEEFLKQKTKFEQMEKEYKIQLQNKEKEIIQKDKEIRKLKDKIAFLNQNIKNIESRKNVDERSKSSQCKKEETFSLTQQDLQNNTSNMNNKTNNNNIKDYLLSRNIPKFDTKKLILRNVPSTSIGPYDDIIKNKTRKQNVISNYNKKNNHVICQSISNYININQSDFNDLSRDNSFNNRRSNKNNSFIIGDNNLKLKLPLNITNNNYNMNKNNVMINLNTNILSNNLQLEQLKIQQKLEDYRKLIDQRIDQLILLNSSNAKKPKKSSIFHFNSTYDKYIGFSAFS